MEITIQYRKGEAEWLWQLFKVKCKYLLCVCHPITIILLLCTLRLHKVLRVWNVRHRNWQFLNYAHMTVIKIKRAPPQSTIITTFASILYSSSCECVCVCSYVKMYAIILLFALFGWHFPLWYCYQLNVNALQSSKILPHKNEFLLV